MAGRPKAEWSAKFRSVGRTLIPGKGILIRVRILLDREPNREISITFESIEEAEKWRDALTVYIDKTKAGM